MFLTGRRAKGFNPFSPKGWDVTAPANGGGHEAGLPTFLSYPFTIIGGHSRFSAPAARRRALIRSARRAER